MESTSNLGVCFIEAVLAKVAATTLYCSTRLCIKSVPVNNMWYVGDLRGYYGGLSPGPKDLP